MCVVLVVDGGASSAAGKLTRCVLRGFMDRFERG